ncbi:unnamed protein product [Linum tenue]|uniref:DRBM domain-containing protein n=1 Tax=Linum tenue TaxID=586396 RepID=A0AAV0N1K0_9ROSI|nr:unnamed protein product [Linum tenue]
MSKFIFCAGNNLWGFLRTGRMFKTQLQELCQKKRWALPWYSAMRDGPDHSPRFKASVSIDGLTFHSPPSCNSFKQAQNEAAQIAFRHFTSPPTSSEVPSNDHHDPDALNSGSSNEALQEAGFLNRSLQFPPLKSFFLFQTSSSGEYVPGFYKNLLQELAQRERTLLPVYKTMKTGPPHLPAFISSVEVGAEKFQGEEGKSKKEAEMNAAKVAYTTLKLASKKCPAPGPTETEGYKEEVKEVINLTAAEAARSSDEVVTKKPEASNYSHSQLVNPAEKIPCPSSSIASQQTKARSELVLNKVRVYTSYPDIEFPQGVTIMPFGDDRWVAIRLELPDQLA